jgi:hypothetical protein
VEAILQHYSGLPEASQGAYSPTYYWISAFAVNLVRRGGGEERGRGEVMGGNAGAEREGEGKGRRRRKGEEYCCRLPICSFS